MATTPDDRRLELLQGTLDMLIRRRAAPSRDANDAAREDSAPALEFRPKGQRS